MFSGRVEPDVRWRLTRVDAVALPALLLIAFGLRAGVIVRSRGGFGGNLGDDAAAYYAGADAIVHGRLPYHDFVLLHPPLLDLMLTPFALLGAVTNDHVGFVAATVTMQLMGAISAGLVVVVARRFGLSRPACYSAGAFYALWYGAIAADSGIRLEAAGTFVSLLGLLALTAENRRRNVFLGGAAFGASAAVKIWGVVPVVVLALWGLTRERTRRSVPTFVAGAGVAVLVVCGLFFAAAPTSMWHMVVTDQLTRRPDHLQRLRQMSGLLDVFPHLTGSAYALVITLIVAVVVAIFALAVRVEATRVIVLIALAELVVLYVAPSFFSNYDGFVAPAVALTVGAAAQTAGSATRQAVTLGRLGQGVAAMALTGSLAMTAYAIVDVPVNIGSRSFPHALMQRAVAGAHCPTPDGPIVLIETNTLSSTLARGCPNWIDVSGQLYTVHGRKFPRTLSVEWQRDLRAYLLSGDVVILFRPKIGIGIALRREFSRFPLIGRQDGYSAYRIPPNAR